MDQYNLTLVNFLLIKQCAKQRWRKFLYMHAGKNPAIYESGRWVETAMRMYQQQIYIMAALTSSHILGFFLILRLVEDVKTQHLGDSM